MVRSIKNPKKAKRKNKKGDGSSSSSSVPSMPTKVWQPGVDNLEEGEELECDPTAYNCLHAFHIGWPCLSFDVVRDSLGLLRTDFPHTVYFVAGTQAENPDWNSIGIFKVSNVSGKRRELVVLGSLVVLPVGQSDYGYKDEKAGAQSRTRRGKFSSIWFCQSILRDSNQESSAEPLTPFIRIGLVPFI
ncbi:GLUTAMATE-RICH WD REPEAT-CONTAINING PROTEIN 1 [Salix purpurea]|uniref:GLUTAMATE-RICH WD REPEAT-CONTAINING PROTEIN 1 n=1 Tax=Salix purpurea TaxID=77065 RepID=A0A9Q0V381_SALPP|nr:GLUTAMATE-RICH WD REPEAT-CONTAINING PROTEIN 1 [Salix purpurea]